MSKTEQKSCRYVLIRHGQTYWNKKNKMQGQVNIPLNGTGRRQAGDLAQELKDYDFDLCLCSPLVRAVQTAEMVVGDREIPMVKSELLAEQSYGLCEGWYQDIVFRIPLFRLYNYQHHPEKYSPPVGGESMRDMIKRAGRALNEVLRPAADDHDLVLVGAHGSMICAMLDWIERVPLKAYWNNLLNNCGYAVVEFDGNGWRILEKH